MLTLLHASDLHFGRFFQPRRAEALMEFASGLEPDVIVLSGDFTQRAKEREYRAARDFIDRLPSVPILVTPGNHDVPLYRVWERFGAPLAKYRRHIRSTLDEVVQMPGATFVTLDSTAPRRAITNGRLDPGQIEFAVRAFASAPSEALRVLVTHHHFVSAPGASTHRPLPGGLQIGSRLAGVGVDLVLGGHVHHAEAFDFRAVAPGGSVDRRMVVVQSGTTSSSRGRGHEVGRNSLNVIALVGGSIEVERHLFDQGKGTFVPAGRSVFPEPDSEAPVESDVGAGDLGRSGEAGAV